MSCSHLEGRNGCEVSVNEKYDYMVVNSINQVNHSQMSSKPHKSSKGQYQFPYSLKGDKCMSSGVIV